MRRAAKLTGIVPPIDQSRGQFFSYRWIEGQVGYLALDTFRFEDLLSWLDRYLWVTPQAVDPGAFREACLAFYREKTLARIRAFLEKSPDSDRPERINGSPVRSVSELISRVDWNGIADHAIASAFHGDLQLDNLIVHPGVGNGFTLIDWREDFAGLDYGDRYYDLAKLNGGLHLDYHRIRDGEPLPFARGADGVRVDDVASGALIRHRDQLHRYCTERRLDLRHIELLTSLIFLNMAPLHHSPFDHFLWNLGQWKLSCCLQEETP